MEKQEIVNALREGFGELAVLIREVVKQHQFEALPALTDDGSVQYIAPGAALEGYKLEREVEALLERGMIIIENPTTD